MRLNILENIEKTERQIDELKDLRVDSVVLMIGLIWGAKSLNNELDLRESI